MRPSLAATVLLVASSLPLFAGSLEVQVRNARRGEVADAVIYAVPERRPAMSEKKTAIMDQKNRMFVPHVLVVETGTSVRFPNSDDIRHQVYSFSPAKLFQLPLYKGTPAKPIVFDKPGVVMLGCNIHDNMNAYIIVVDTPYFAKTDDSGNASLPDLPAGRYMVHAWFPDSGQEGQPRTVTISGGERQQLSFVSTRDMARQPDDPMNEHHGHGRP